LQSDPVHARTTPTGWTGSSGFSLPARVRPVDGPAGWLHQPAIIERGQDTGLPAAPRIKQGGIGLVPVEVQHLAAGKVEGGKRREIIIIAAALDPSHS
jgi:hypothetical protein